MMLSPEQYVHNQVATYPVLYHADSYESAARKVFDQFFNVIGSGVYLPEELDLPVTDLAKAEKFLRGENVYYGYTEVEDIIRAMQANEWCWQFSWAQSRRGGHYIFEVKIPKLSGVKND